MIRIADSQSVCVRRMAAFALATLTTVNGLAYARPVSKFTNEGAYASAYGSAGCVYVFLEVSRGGPKSAPQTFLYYELYRHVQRMAAARRRFGHDSEFGLHGEQEGQCIVDDN